MGNRPSNSFTHVRGTISRSPNRVRITPYNRGFDAHIKGRPLLPPAVTSEPGRLTGATLVATCLVVAFLLAYFPDVGHGFIKDDFAWIYHGQLKDVDSIRRIVLGSVGFYRPVVTVSFGLNDLLFGTWSYGFGISNLLLALACAASLFMLARALGLTVWAAILAAALWAFNFHGINMAVLWLSGRTALLLTLFSVLAARAVVYEQPWRVFGFSLLALLSKEEAIALPMICFVLAIGSPTGILSLRDRVMTGLKASVPAFVALGIYAVLRLQSGAFTPGTAPSFYRLSFEPQAALRNVAEYADRSATLAVAVLLILAAYLGRKPGFSGHRVEIVWLGAVWAVSGLTLTIWLPVRSSLYPVFPSVGVALLVASIADGMFDKAPTAKLKRAAIVAAVLPFALMPVYWSRNIRWVELADISQATFAAIQAHAHTLPIGTLIELRDDLSTRASFLNTFGTHCPEASHVYFANRYRLWIEPPPPEIALTGVARPEASTTAVFELRRGEVVRVR